MIRNLELQEVPICQALEFADELLRWCDKVSEPGEYLIYTAVDNRLQRHRWWRFPEFEQSIDDERAAVDQLLDLLHDACAIRKVADVPVTIFLSGGVDSSLIQAILKCDVSYTVQFSEFEHTINEREYVQEFAAQQCFEPRIVTPTRDEFLETFSALARHIEFPVGSFSVFPLFCLSRQARRDGFVVALSGEGADELFSGYYRNELLLREAERVEEDLRGPYGTLCRRYFGSDVERFCRMVTRQGLAGVPLLADFFAPQWSDERTFAQNLSLLESIVFLQPLLVMADRLAMGNSLEVRNPYLDYRIVEFSAKLSDRLRYRDGQGKWICCARRCAAWWAMSSASRAGASSTGCRLR